MASDYDTTFAAIGNVEDGEATVKWSLLSRTRVSDATGLVSGDKKRFSCRSRGNKPRIIKKGRAFNLLISITLCEE